MSDFLNKSLRILLIVYKKGYRVLEDGTLVNKAGDVLKGGINSKGYYTFSFKYKGCCYGVPVHRLQAYQKFGDKLFESGIEVRHLDGKNTNNALNNIEIGTHSENMMDISEEKRRERSKNGLVAASKVNRRWSDAELIAIRKRHSETRSYEIVMKEFNISSKGTLYYILHNEYLA